MRFRDGSAPLRGARGYVFGTGTAAYRRRREWAGSRLPVRGVRACVRACVRTWVSVSPLSSPALRVHRALLSGPHCVSLWPGCRSGRGLCPKQRFFPPGLSLINAIPSKISAASRRLELVFGITWVTPSIRYLVLQSRCECLPPPVPCCPRSFRSF